MANTAEKLRRLVLSAEELKSLESWNSHTIEEWLNIFDNLITLADSVDEAEEISKVDMGEIDDLSSLVGLTAIDRNARAASASTTSAGDEIIVCTAAITVTLNAEPDDQEMVTVKITNGDVTIDANGKTLDGQTDITFIAANFQGQPSIDCKYLAELDAWYIV